MKDNYKRLTSVDLPSYNFIPGHGHPHPNKEGGYRFNLPEPVVDSFLSWEKSPEYLYFIDLINLEYYWEAHVYGEALWNYFNRVGESADLLKALIKYSAMKINAIQNKPNAVADHHKRSLELANAAFKDNKLVLGLSEENVLNFINGQKFLTIIV